jgi:hypothetical protein
MGRCGLWLGAASDGLEETDDGMPQRDGGSLNCI